ncbi:MAG: alpha-galactosidase [Clostridia bacterium]|nr:alpha-galactosidase [Clostridia bacterium]
MSVTYCADTQTFYLDGKDVTYAFCLTAGYPEHLYFGKKIPHDSLLHMRTGGAAEGTIPFGSTGRNMHTIPSELTNYGRGDYREPAILVENPSGDRISELLYEGHEILSEKPKISGMPSMDGGETLVLRLKDKLTGFQADLYYTAYDDSNVIARRAVYRNGTNGKAILRRAYSFSMGLPGNGYRMLSLHGAWCRERRMEIIPLHHGVVSIDSKRLSSSAALNPFMGILSEHADENQGEVYGVSLVYSSSYVLKAEGTSGGDTLLTGGINDFDFHWDLAPGEEFETPEVVLAFSDCGLGGMSRAFHDAYRNHLINKQYVKKPRPLVLNNWEGTHFNFTLDKLKAIIDGAAGTGIDTFVLDDGWFGYSRDNEKSSMGDWHIVNPQKLPGGFAPLVEHIHSKGMKFGLWFEPEMIGPNSDLLKNHPDYAITIDGREPCLGRCQMMMDLTRKDVRDYIVETVNRVIRENNISYVKWDFNRNATETYSRGRAPERQAEFAHRYALGLYDLCERIVEANPQVFFEGCSAGGARFDPAMLHYFSQIWTSDNTDADDRTCIQYGTSMVYPLSAMSCHVSHSPNITTKRPISYKTRSDIAHLGATGYELDASDWTDEDRARTAEEIKEYKSCQDLILEGDLYRLDNPMTSNYFSFLVVAKDQSRAILTTYRRQLQAGGEPKRIRLLGLDPQKNYRVRELDLVASGSTLMNVGLVTRFPSPLGDYQTLKFHLDVE